MSDQHILSWAISRLLFPYILVVSITINGYWMNGYVKNFTYVTWRYGYSDSDKFGLSAVKMVFKNTRFVPFVCNSRD